MADLQSFYTNILKVYLYISLPLRHNSGFAVYKTARSTLRFLFLEGAMGFNDSYKHLEKLCGEVLNDDRRVSAYIAKIPNLSNRSRRRLLHRHNRTAITENPHVFLSDAPFLYLPWRLLRQSF